MYVCYSWLSPHSVYSLASQMKHSPLFSQREKAKIQREIKADVSYGHCCLFVCVCVCFWELCIRVLLAKAVTLHDQSA